MNDSAETEEMSPFPPAAITADRYHHTSTCVFGSRVGGRVLG